jgi:Ca2+-binding RTX toxin-like protein
VVVATFDVLRLECLVQEAAPVVAINGQIVRVVVGAQVADPANPNNGLAGPALACEDLFAMRATGTAGNDVLEVLTDPERPADLQAFGIRVEAAAGEDVVNLGGRTAEPCPPSVARCSMSERSVIGGDGDDQLIGSTGNDTLVGEAGNDTIDGAAGNDRLLGGFGATTSEDGADVVDGGAGNDRISGGGGTNALRGGTGDDAILADTAEPVDASVWDGGPGNDTLAVGDGPMRLVGGSGNDRITIARGVTVRANGIKVSAGAGNDSVEFSRATAGVVIRLGRGRDVAAGGAGDDFIDGEGGHDRIAGGGGDDVLVGRAGNDALGGDAGRDALFAGPGNDALNGGAGTDFLAPGPGNNRLSDTRGDRCTSGDPTPPVPGGRLNTRPFVACPTAAGRRSALLP